MEREVNVSKLATALARNAWIRENGKHGRDWAESAWDDMGGSEGNEERAQLESHYELLILHELREQGVLPAFQR